MYFEKITTLLEMEKKEDWTRLLHMATNFIKEYPKSSFGWAVLAKGYRNTSQIQRAISNYKKASEIDPEDNSIIFNLVECYEFSGDLISATNILERSIFKDDKNLNSLLKLASIYMRLSEFQKAAYIYDKVLCLDECCVEAVCNRCFIYLQSCNYAAADTIVRKLKNTHSNIYQIEYIKAKIFQNKKEWIEAIKKYQIVIALTNKSSELLLEIGNCCINAGLFREAESVIREAIIFDPDFIPGYLSIALCYQENGKLEDANIFLDAAVKKGSIGAMVRKALYVPPILYSKENISEIRNRIINELNKLIKLKIEITNPITEVGQSNFYLAYHDKNDRELAEFIAEFYRKICDNLNFKAPHLIKNKLLHRKKKKIGIYSAYLNEHSVSLCFNGVANELGKLDNYEIILISTVFIDVSKYRRISGTLIVSNDLKSSQDMISRQELDILIYLDIGMEPIGYFLAFSRLASYQIMFGGHPVTSGLSTIDYYISSKIFEPSNYEEHYTEKVVLLNDPLVYFEPIKRPEINITREDMGLPNEGNLYICPFRIQKIHPDFDEIINQILSLDLNGYVIIFKDERYEWWSNKLKNRLVNNITIKNIERILFLDWLPGNKLAKAIELSNVVLDPVGFGIGSTATYIYTIGTPMVTLSGKYLKSRVGHGLNLLMELSEFTAHSVEEYVSLAVQFANNEEKRLVFKDKCIKNRAKLFENTASTQEFVKWLKNIEN